MNKKIQRVTFQVVDPAGIPVPGASEITEDFISDARKLIGINIKSGISGGSLLEIKVKGRTLADKVPVDAFMCNEDYVSPDTRFNTLLSDVGEINKEDIFLKITDDGTAGSYPYTATALLLLEVQ